MSGLDWFLWGTGAGVWSLYVLGLLRYVLIGLFVKPARWRMRQAWRVADRVTRVFIVIAWLLWPIAVVAPVPTQRDAG